MDQIKTVEENKPAVLEPKPLDEATVPTKNKKNITGYQLFVKNTMENDKASLTALKQTEKIVEIAQRWKKLPLEEQAVWKSKASTLDPVKKCDSCNK